MDKEELRKLLNQPYKTENWKRITDSVFPNVSYLQKPQAIPYTSDKVKSFKQIGNVKLHDGKNLAMFEVLVDENVQIARNKVELRKLVTPYIDQEHNHGVLVIYEQGKADYRFTFTAKSTEFDEVESDLINVETDSKRYTYVLGQNETCKTAANRFWELSKNKDKATIKDVQDAFSVEKLSKQFFTEYKAQYESMVAYLTSGTKAYYASVFNGDEKKIRDFVKLFLGRIIFIKFIQKKGWLGVPANSDNWENGQANFIDKAYRNYKTPDIFLSSFLNPLFFDALNMPDRPNDMFSLTKTKVPYLNGGLFENEDPKLQLIDFPSSYFDSLFDFLDQYNFTIDESDPLEREVSIDPEMLGHIFENLLEDNKDKGAYYTPKEIVHYMCQESLIEYLNTFLNEKKALPDDEDQKKHIEEAIRKFVVKKQGSDLVNDYDEQLAIALHDVKICDPAIGSGAFPMGLLNEIFQCLQVLHDVSPDVVGAVWEMENWQPNIVKQNIIQNSIYGVDIEKGAVDIARLRFWLSLIVDEPVPTALPNLDYKIVVGNSLVSTFEDDVIDIDWSIDDTSYGLFATELAEQKIELLKTISKKQKDFFKPRSNKVKLSAEIRNLKIDLLANQLRLMVELKDFSVAPKPADYRNKSKTKFTEDYNRFLQTISWKEKIKKLNKLKENQDMPLNFFDWKLDFPEIMNERVNKKGGFDIVIANPPYVNIANISDVKYRSYIQSNYNTVKNKSDLYSVFIEKAHFLSKENAKICFIYPKTWMGSDSFSKFREFITNNFRIHNIINLGYGIFENATVSTVITVFSKLSVTSNDIILYQLDKNEKGQISFIKQDNKLPYSQIKSTPQYLFSFTKAVSLKIKTKPLKELVDFSLGIKTSDDKKFIINYKKDDSTFLMLRGKNIRKYEHDKPSEYIWYKPNLMMKKVGAGPRKLEYFLKDKILIQGICNGVLRCSYDSKKYLVNDKIHIAFNPKDYSLKVILAILNSTLMSFITKSLFGNYLEIKINQLELLPFPKKIDKSKEKYLVNIVNERLNCTNPNEIMKLELSIDNLVYKLYELTYDEIKVIDPAFSLTEKQYNSLS